MTISDVRTAILTARQKQSAAEEAAEIAIEAVREMLPDADKILCVSVDAPNLEEAVLRYIQTGEFDVHRLLDEIFSVWMRRKLSEEDGHE